MASTSLTLGPHWEAFIKEKISSGRYGSVSALVRDSLRLLEEREMKLEGLRSALVGGETRGLAGELGMEEIKRKTWSKVSG